MQLETHYLNLYDELGANTPGERMPVTVERLSGVFQCTDRNAKFILRKMEEAGWIAWHPGRGRGRTSEIELNVEREQILQDIAKRLAEQGDVRNAMNLVHERARTPESAERFSAWLSDFFGFRQEDRSERTTDTLRIPVFDQILSLDPALIYFCGEGHLCRQIYDTLVKYDPESDGVVPRLAHHWESNEDATRWTFYLRKGVLFHHKRELDAHDVVFTFERLRDHSNFWMIDSVAAKQAYVVEFRLKDSCVWFPRIAGFDNASILPRDAVKQRGDAFFSVPIGTGPFQIAKLTEQVCVLDAFPYYYLGRAHLDRVEMHFISEGNELEAARGPVDLVHKGSCNAPLPTGYLERLRTSTAGCCRLLAFNMKREGPQRNPAFREALGLMIDREDMMARLGDDRLRLAEGFCDVGAETPSAPPADPDRIRELLAKSGYDGETIILDSNVNREREAMLLREYAARYGVRIEPRLSRFCDFYKYANQTPGHIVFYNAVFEDGEATFIDMVFSPRSAVGMHLLDDELRNAARSIVRRMFRERTAEGRWNCVAELSRLVRSSHAILFLFHSAFDSYYNPRIGGVSHNTLGLIDYRNVWYKTAQEEDAADRLQQALV
ncbi:ABC transporter substrate-binding protein [Paenibacillus sp.]|uniref:ABC transporter substrate-binding protein n=1 Tax=Paenibacillus sp. TaxID=58172 RepID=UPI002D4DE3CD|nr:ABC transporter substrate-binding protein [Paenibacillus sp.]HZG85065.1 ABC transporter substrate-binding protein [Paenibacillus sp.]